MHTHSEQAKDEENGMPIIVMKDSRAKMIVSKVATSKGVVDYAVAVAKKTMEQLGHKKAILKSDNEPAILVLKEAARREFDVEIVPEEAPVGDLQANGLVQKCS